MQHAPMVTVVVVSWNTRELLARCLQSLRGEVDSRRALVWVVDNQSNDGSPTMVRSDFRWARLTVASANLGFGAGVNTVAHEAETEWIVAANADVEVEPGALDALVEAGGRRPDAGVLAPRLQLPTGEIQRSVFRFPRIGDQALAAVGAHRLSRHVADRLGFGELPAPGTEVEVDYAMGAFLMFRRLAFEAVGGFDPRQWMYAEDMDVSWRLRRAGWTTVYVPQATVRHVGGAAASIAFAEGVPMLKLAAHYAWLERRRGRPAMLAIAVINLLGAAARLTYLWPLAAFSPARWEPARKRVLEWWSMNLDALAKRRSTEHP
jgi:N-acetylglucosaminyl-diphospho-decaprenol L-rhamnosyltransferase